MLKFSHENDQLLSTELRGGASQQQGFDDLIGKDPCSLGNLMILRCSNITLVVMLQ